MVVVLSLVGLPQGGALGCWRWGVHKHALGEANVCCIAPHGCAARGPGVA